MNIATNEDRSAFLQYFRLDPESDPVKQIKLAGQIILRKNDGIHWSPERNLVIPQSVEGRIHKLVKDGEEAMGFAHRPQVKLYFLEYILSLFLVTFKKVFLHFKKHHQTLALGPACVPTLSPDIKFLCMSLDPIYFPSTFLHFFLLDPESGLAEQIEKIEKAGNFILKNGDVQEEDWCPGEVVGRVVCDLVKSIVQAGISCLPRAPYEEQIDKAIFYLGTLFGIFNKMYPVHHPDNNEDIRLSRLIKVPTNFQGHQQSSLSHGHYHPYRLDAHPLLFNLTEMKRRHYKQVFVQ